MILKTVTLPVGVDGKSYWEAMILKITANFKQELFEQFQGKIYLI
jgi:hypothetical protein